jgi:menaquinone-dependent protoporphyrinogen oxidase
MPEKTLVGYATKYGSTQEVAEVIADVLRETSRDVEVRELHQVKSLAGYSAVVMGAPFYMFHWMKDARKFLSRHQAALEKLPVAVFALGPTDASENQEKNPELFAQLDKALEAFPWLAPADQALFGGKFDPEKLKFPMKMFVGKMPASDIRDWDRIRAWAEGVGEKI